jgi:aquaporin Z
MLGPGGERMTTPIPSAHREDGRAIHQRVRGARDERPRPEPPSDRGAENSAGLTRRKPRHWVEYGIEAVALGVFLIVAAVGATVLQHPGSPVRQAIADPLIRRVLMGLAMGATVVAIVYSRWGARSGAHLNPALTLAFFRLGKVTPGDAAGYVTAQFLGGLAGISAAVLILGDLVAVREVNYVATVPGPWGAGVAFLGEATIAFIQMTMVLHVSNHARFARYTGIVAGVLVATYITIEEPLSGMSLNPARSLGPALFAGTAGSLWVYFAAPLAGMALAGEVYARTRGLAAVFCAKLHHGARVPCPFNCRFHEMPQ